MCSFDIFISESLRERKRREKETLMGIKIRKTTTMSSIKYIEVSKTGINVLDSVVKFGKTSVFRVVSMLVFTLLTFVTLSLRIGKNGVV